MSRHPIRIAANRAALYEAEVRGTRDGVELGRKRAQHEARIAQYQAIRRALKVARKCDTEATFAANCADWHTAREYACAARSIREAIRAAIRPAS